MAKRFSELTPKQALLFILLKIFDVIRYIFSFALFFGAIGIIVYGISQSKSAFWPDHVHWAVPLVLLVVLLWILAVLEGLEVIAVELCKNPVQDPEKFPRAHRFQQLCAKPGNLPKFVLGRQCLVLITVFFLARATTINDATVFPDALVALLETGLLGTVIVVILGQLIPQILAAQYPVHFANFPLMDFVFRVCLMVEYSGIIHAAWVIGPSVGKVLRYKPVVLEEDVSKPVLHRTLSYQLHERVTSSDSLAMSQQIVEKLSMVPHFASVQEISTKLRDGGIPVPYFLWESTEQNFIPPHLASLAIYAHQLLIQASIAEDPVEKKALEEKARMYASLALVKESE